MLRGLEREEGIPFDELVEIIEHAIQQAYIRHTANLGGTIPDAEDVNVELDRKTGDITALVPEFDDADEIVGHAPITTDEFGRIAANAAKQVINQRLRDLSDDAVLGQYKDREGQIISGVVQQASNPRLVHIDLGDVEAVLPPEEQVPGEDYAHGTRLRVFV